MAARLSALCASRTLPPGFFIFKDSWYSFLLEAESTPGPVRPEGHGKTQFLNVPLYDTLVYNWFHTLSSKKCHNCIILKPPLSSCILLLFLHWNIQSISNTIQYWAEKLILHLQSSPLLWHLSTKALLSIFVYPCELHVLFISSLFYSITIITTDESAHCETPLSVIFSIPQWLP
jgi:hypothetical protein